MYQRGQDYLRLRNHSAFPLPPRRFFFARLFKPARSSLSNDAKESLKGSLSSAPVICLFRPLGHSFGVYFDIRFFCSDFRIDWVNSLHPSLPHPFVLTLPAMERDSDEDPRINRLGRPVRRSSRLRPSQDEPTGLRGPEFEVEEVKARREEKRAEEQKEEETAIAQPPPAPPSLPELTIRHIRAATLRRSDISDLMMLADWANLSRGLFVRIPLRAENAAASVYRVGRIISTPPLSPSLFLSRPPSPRFPAFFHTCFFSVFFSFPFSCQPYPHAHGRRANSGDRGGSWRPATNVLSSQHIQLSHHAR